MTRRERPSLAEKARRRDGDVAKLAPRQRGRTLREWAEVLPEDSFVGRAVRAALEREGPE